MFDKNAKILTVEEDNFNKELDNLNAKFENLKTTDLEYYTIAAGSWVNAVNNLLEDPSITESLRVRLERILEIYNS